MIKQDGGEVFEGSPLKSPYTYFSDQFYNRIINYQEVQQQKVNEPSRFRAQQILC
jgi:hypothetical protein